MVEISDAIKAINEAKVEGRISDGGKDYLFIELAGSTPEERREDLVRDKCRTLISVVSSYVNASDRHSINDRISALTSWAVVGLREARPPAESEGGEK